MSIVSSNAGAELGSRRKMAVNVDGSVFAGITLSLLDEGAAKYQDPTAPATTRPIRDEAIRLRRRFDCAPLPRGLFFALHFIATTSRSCRSSSALARASAPVAVF